MSTTTTHPNSDSVIPGQLRNLGMVLAAFLASLGYFNGVEGFIAPIVIGVLLLAYSVWMKQGWRRITTSLRKLIGAAAGLAIAAGVVGAGQFQAFENLWLVAVPLLWSFLEKKATPAQAVQLVLAGFWISMPCLLTSCPGIQVSGGGHIIHPETGAKVGIKTDGKNHTIYGRGTYIDKDGNPIGEWEVEATK